MNEEEARHWLTANFHVPRETLALLGRLVDLLKFESTSQNLIAASTIDTIWARHIVDSAQLLPLANAAGDWVDLGSGAGFPGLVVAFLGGVRVTLVESRRKRVAFLAEAIDLLGIGTRTTIAAGRAETLPPRGYATISARAFAPLERLLPIGERFADADTRWLLPKGRGAQAELDAVARTWQGSFRIEPSVTDPHSAIIVAEQVRRRKRR